MNILWSVLENAHRFNYCSVLSALYKYLKYILYAILKRCPDRSPPPLISPLHASVQSTCICSSPLTIGRDCYKDPPCTGSCWYYFITNTQQVSWLSTWVQMVPPLKKEICNPVIMCVLSFLTRLGRVTFFGHFKCLFKWKNIKTSLQVVSKSTTNKTWWPGKAVFEAMMVFGRKGLINSRSLSQHGPI